MAEADHLGGFALFVQDGKLKHTYSFVGVQEFRQESTTKLPTGTVNVRMEFAADAPKPATGSQVTLYVNDEAVGGGRIEHTVPARFSGLDIGRDNGMPVDRKYADKSPFAFTGTVKKVVFDVNPHASEDHERQLGRGRRWHVALPGIFLRRRDAATNPGPTRHPATRPAGTAQPQQTDRRDIR